MPVLTAAFFTAFSPLLRRYKGFIMGYILCSEIYFFCIAILCIVLFWLSSSNTKSASELWMKYVLVCFLLSFVSNYVGSLLGGLLPEGPKNIWILYVFKSLYYFLISTGVYLWCGYTEISLGNDTFRTNSLMKSMLLFLPNVVPVIVILTNFHTHLLFQINENHIYTRGPQFDFLMLYFIVSTLIADIKILSNSRGEIDPVRRSQRKQIATFPLCLIAGWLFTLIERNIPALCVCITVELLCLQIGSANRQILIDKLTQVNNRQNLNGYLLNKLRQHPEELYLMMIDLDSFKSVNDNYGHLEGDAALVRVAVALKQACKDCRKHPYIARYGGDEFIIVTEMAEKEVRELCARIHTTLRKLNEDAGVPYALNLSIGYAAWKEEMTPNELISAADTELYKSKKELLRNSR